MPYPFDIFVRNFGNDAPIVTLTVGLNSSKANAEPDKVSSENVSMHSDDDDAQLRDFAENSYRGSNAVTVFDLKQMIYEAQDKDPVFTPERQTLFYNGIKLEFDHKSISHYDIKAGATIFLQN
jgi:hypothetical protein